MGDLKNDKYFHKFKNSTCVFCMSFETCHLFYCNNTFVLDESCFVPIDDVIKRKKMSVYGGNYDC